MIWLSYRLSMLTPEQCRPWLSASEWQYAQLCSAKRARQFCNGRRLARRVLLQKLSVSPVNIEITLPSDQAPALVVSGHRLHMSVTHSGQAVAVAISPDHAIGVDLEQLKQRRFAELAADYPALHRATDSDEFYRCWTSAEAYSKLSGQPLMTVLQQPLPASLQRKFIYLSEYLLCIGYQQKNSEIEVTDDSL